MFQRKKNEITPVEWGNGTSHRLLTAADKMGFTVAHTIVNAGTESKLQYRRHLEACYCIGGSGEVSSADGSKVLDIRPGTIYALDQHDAHLLRASDHENLELISIFNPALDGKEHHVLDESGFSQY